MGDAHDIDVAELGARLPPIGVGDDVVAADFPSGIEFHARRHRPVEQGVVPRHLLARRSGLTCSRKVEKRPITPLS